MLSKRALNVLRRPPFAGVSAHQLAQVSLRSQTAPLRLHQAFPTTQKHLKLACGRYFSTTPVRQDREEEKEKRLPSDDPNQLPPHLLTTKQPGQSAIRMGWFRRTWRDFHLKMLIYHNKEFVAEDFVDGAKTAFEAVMERFAAGSTDGFDQMMTERMRRGFADTLDEYRSNALTCDYDVGKVDHAEIVNASFVKRESGELLVWVDVQFLSQQRFTLRDKSGRAVGQEGEWLQHVAVWRFQSPVETLHWVLYDLL